MAEYDALIERLRRFGISYEMLRLRREAADAITDLQARLAIAEKERNEARDAHEDACEIAANNLGEAFEWREMCAKEKARAEAAEAALVKAIEAFETPAPRSPQYPKGGRLMPEQEQLRRVKADNTSGKADARKSWAVVGAKGAVEFWCCQRTDTHEAYGGLEYHARTEKDWTSHNDFCQLLGGPCWHDGSSSIAHDRWIPHILPLGDEAIFGALEEYYRDWK